MAGGGGSWPILVESAQTWKQWGGVAAVLSALLIVGFSIVGVVDPSSRPFAWGAAGCLFVPMLVVGVLFFLYGERWMRKRTRASPPPPGFA
ncbi:MAG TPA: hypothetical protein VJ400_02750 [Thermoplasmata archaeon]|nr:hypothetical protein [Thermoplasmata archaeon]